MWAMGHLEGNYGGDSREKILYCFSQVSFPNLSFTYHPNILDKACTFHARESISCASYLESLFTLPLFYLARNLKNYSYVG